MCDVKLRSVHCTKDLGVRIASNLKFSQHWNDAVNKVNRMLRFVKRMFSFKNKDVILPFYNNLVRPHLEYAVQFWSSHFVKDIAKPENAQCRAAKKVSSLCNKPYSERLGS